MYTKESLMNELIAMGIRSDDLLTVHTSLRAVGEIDPAGRTGAHVMIDALRDCVSDGLLVIPSHTFRNIREDGQVFNIRKTMPCIGTLPCVAVELANQAVDSGDFTCIRSMHVSHSVVAFGKSAREFTEADRYTKTRTPITGSYGKLYHMGGKILLLGVDLSRNTFIHMVDECIDDTVYGSVVIEVTDYDGTVGQREELITRGPAAASFVRYQQPLEAAGAIVHGKIGDASSMLVDARKCFETVMRIRRSEQSI